MTDFSQTMTNFSAQLSAHRRCVSSEIDRLKQAVLGPLADLGIASVEVRFDGYGDSGAVEEVECRDDEDERLEIADAVQIQIEDDDGKCHSLSLKQALENLAESALEIYHPGWENNDGAGGALEINVAAGSFMLDCKLRYTAYDDHYTEL